jgi:hypothetical protein
VNEPHSFRPADGMPRLMVTGGSGFLGGYVLREVRGP